MGLGMKHELDPDQYRAVLKEIRKLNDELHELRNLVFILAAANTGLYNSMDDVLRAAKELKNQYLKGEQ